MVYQIQNNLIQSNNPTDQSEVTQAREEYANLYAAFLTASRNGGAESDAVQKAVQDLLHFLNDPKNVQLLAEFANTHGAQPYPNANFANDVAATKTYLNGLVNDSGSQYSGADEFLHNLSLWTQRVV